MKRTLIIIMLVLFPVVFFSCSTFPVPESDTDALLIIPIKAINETETDYFGKYRIRIKNERTNESKYYILSPDKNYLRICSLEPGSYHITERTFIYDKSGKTGNTATPNIRFSLESRSLTILSHVFTFKMIKKSPTWDSMYGNFNAPTTEDAGKIFSILFAKEGIEQWKISSFTKKNDLYSEFIKE